MSDPTISTNSEIIKPGWGATIGIFFLCWLIAAFCSGVASMVFASQNGIGAYTIGGVFTFALAIACGAYYRSTARAGKAALKAAIGGIVIGVLAMVVVLSAVR